MEGEIKYVKINQTNKAHAIYSRTGLEMALKLQIGKKLIIAKRL